MRQMITAVAAPPFPHVAVSLDCCTACQLLKLQLHLAAAIATAAAAAAAVALVDRCTCSALHVPCGRQGICSKFSLVLAGSCVRTSMHKSVLVTVVGCI